jgi:hypothetical protein
MIQYVREFRAHPDVVKLARRIVQLCGAKDHLCEMKAIFLWSKGHFRYVNDPVSGEVIATPASQIAEIETPADVIHTILGPDLIRQMQGFGIGAVALTPPNRIECRGCFREALSGPEFVGKTSGDCDEGATFLATMLSAIGIVPRFQFGGFMEPSGKACNWHHVWVAGQSDAGEWVDMDVTEEKSTLGWAHPFECRGHADIFENP